MGIIDAGQGPVNGPVENSNGRPLGSTPDRGANGDLVFVCAELDFAAEMRRVRMHAAGYFEDVKGIKDFVEQRAVIVLHVRSPGQAEQAATYCEQQAYAERVGVLNLGEMGFQGAAGDFIAWWIEALREQRYRDYPAFTAQADLRAKWRRKTLIDLRADDDDDHEPGPEPYQDPGHYILAKTGAPHSCVTNVMRWLHIAGPRLEYDTFRDRLLVDGEILRDDHIIRLTSAMEVEWQTVVHENHVDHSLRTLAHQARFSSLRRYLTGLKWDGIPRVDHFLVAHGQATDTDYHHEASRIFFLSAVARAMEPGCKVDTVLLLIANQGIGKSDTFRALCPYPEWFTDDVGNIAGDRAGENLRGKWLAEMAELSRVNQSTLEAVKRFITCQADRYKVPYEREVRDFPRTNIFVGSTNEETPLKDSENRRFLPVYLPSRSTEEKETAIEAIVSIRDQLWAEALVRYKAGEKWWTRGGTSSGDLLQEVQKMTRKATLIEAWCHIIRERSHDVEIATVRMAAEWIGIPMSELDKGKQTRIGIAFKRIGWISHPGVEPDNECWYDRPGTSGP